MPVTHARNDQTMKPRRLAAPHRFPPKKHFSSRVVRLTTVALAAVVVVFATPAATAQSSTPTTPTCADADGDGNSFCTLTPGYKLKTTSPIADPSLLTISNCCERDDSKAAFAACDSAGPGGAGLGGVQAPMEGDSSWLFQDSAGFAQQLDRFTGLCFSVLINPTDCQDSGDPLAAPKCCTKKPPSAMQFKIATPTGSSVQPGSKRANALANLSKCGIAWANGATITTRGLKRVTKWEKVVSSDHAQFFNVPLTFPAKARQATFCMYTNNVVDSTIDCTWESICGLKDESIPFVGGGAAGTGNGVGALDNEYAQGCEIRLVGKKAPATSQCCSPPMSLVSFDSQAMDDDPTVAAGAAAARASAASGEAAATATVLPPPSAALAVPESSNMIRARRVGSAAEASSGGSSGGAKKSSAAVVLRRGRFI